MVTWRWVGLSAVLAWGAAAEACGSGHGVASSASTSGATGGAGGTGGTGGTSTGTDGGTGAACGTAKPTPFPVLPANDKSLLAMPRLVVIVGPTEPYASQLFAFGDALLQSAWLKAVGHDYGIGAAAGATSVHVTGGPVATTMDTAALRLYVDATIAANPTITPDGNTIYLFFHPPGTNHGDACADLGAHGTLSATTFNGTQVDALAWAQRCTTPAGLSDLDALTITASHEVLEAATDDFPPHGYAMPYKLWALGKAGTPWSISSWSYLQGDAVEVGDFCEGTIVHEGSFAYQRIWSISAAASGGDPCVPALTDPYYSATAPSDWIAVTAGTTAMVPITGWSTGARGDWNVVVERADTFTSPFTPTFGSNTSTTLNEGCTAMLQVTTPSAAGAFAVFKLVSSDSPPDPTTGFIPVPASGDQKHIFTFGIRTTCDGCTLPASCGDGKCDTTKGESCGTCPDDCGPCGAVCGASNFSVQSGTCSCPTHAACQPDGSCACDAGYTSLSCDGSPCSGSSCVAPDYWCVPSACNQANFSTSCPGNSTCPTEATCAAAGKCHCAPGAYISTCEGQPCPSSGCSFPDWWCNVCGGPGVVTCSGYVCPAFSACGTSNDCVCMSGYRAVSCLGEPCEPGGNNCPGGEWWCFPD